MKLLVLVILGVGLLDGLEALDKIGPCRQNLPVQTEFDIAQYLGTWYEIKRYENVNQRDGDCVTAEYSLNTATMEMSIVNSMKKLPIQDLVVARGRGTLATENGQAKFRIRYDSPQSTFAELDYWILTTDYRNYAVVWSCRANGANSIESAWLLSRKPTLTSTELVLANNFITLYLETDSFRITEQDTKVCNSAATIVHSLFGVMTAWLILMQITTKNT